MKIEKTRFPLLIVGLIITLILMIIIAVSVGTLKIPFTQTFTIFIEKIFNLEPTVNETFSGVIWKIRLPRVIMGLVIGAGLALCGVVMQAIVQNPLADPYLLGISAGGYLGATFFIILGSGILGLFSGLGLAVVAFLGALSAAIAVLFLASFKSSITTTKLILSGTIINAGCTAIANFIIAVSGSDNTITRITYWTMGSLSAAKWESLFLPSIAVSVCFVFFLTQYRTLNTMLQGDEIAITLGIRLNFYRKFYIVIIALLTGILVSACGIIGFVGLIIPHIARALIGPDHRRLVLVSVLVGGIFLVAVDVLARTILHNIELPIGIFTALVGAPFFAYIMIRKNYSFSN
ncbi:iron ABC transporter permease [Niallia sp. NCCP-28]|uniref:FecCD family ABC transporter permease n=1 Tax=Niallia sp. NCCP-28 TaxID=2934712 RepID=UPI0020834007|nr:iron ABC transporter permease [Niallia sp. NCCP-28]GKU83977.1 ABC transporter [Niallia sp. NCCP-28]